MSAKKVTEQQPRYSVQTARPAKAHVSHKPIGKAQPPPASTAKLRQGLSKADLAWLSLAEPSFAFWDNEEDAVAR